MKTTLKSVALTLLATLSLNTSAPRATAADAKDTKQPLVQIAILLDTSGSMAIASTFKVDGKAVSLGGSVSQFLNQSIGVLFTAALAGIVTWILLRVIDKTVGLRVSEEDETIGLDLSQHGEQAYNE